MNEKELLAKLKEKAEGDFRWYSNNFKEDRERWVVSEFLSKIDITYKKEEIISLEQNNKIDVKFRTSNFQIKEILDPNFKRGKLYKDAWKSLSQANSLDEVNLVGDLRDAPPLAKMFELVLDEAAALAKSKKYYDKKSELDLLFYITRTRASLFQNSELVGDAFRSLGWRSVSCVNSKQAIVLFTSDSAPEFLVERTGEIYEITG